MKKEIKNWLDSAKYDMETAKDETDTSAIIENRGINCGNI
jgi:hypothetical protein